MLVRWKMMFLMKAKQPNFEQMHQIEVCRAASGCPNACFRPQIADFSLIGQMELMRDAKSCTCCGACALACPEEAIAMEGGLPALDRERCLLCGNCIRVCAARALYTERKGLALMPGGRLGRHPRLAQRLADLALPQEALDRMRGLLESYLNNARPKERFGSFLERCGIFAELGG
jgi:anaerobic sulfite reductase subunit C